MISHAYTEQLNIASEGVYVLNIMRARMGLTDCLSAFGRGGAWRIVLPALWRHVQQLCDDFMHRLQQLVRRCIALCQRAHLIIVQICGSTVQASSIASDKAE